MAEDLRFTDPEPRIHPTAELKGCKLGRYVAIGERVVLREVSVGDFSYFERQAEAIYTTIGKFCSIAANSRINALEHPIERVSQHKLTYRPNEYFRYLGVDQGFRERRRGKAVTIGHDVWIGHGAVILPGVTIGTGAVVGANAVVRHHVAPYTIVAGAPARVLRLRFPAAIAERLLALAWWDWPAEQLYEAVPDMQALSVEAFLDKWELLADPPQPSRR
jgi:phosphonate metabolism protein (transferase hexapeptide repeat family)